MDICRETHRQICGSISPQAAEVSSRRTIELGAASAIDTNPAPYVDETDIVEILLRLADVIEAHCHGMSAVNPVHVVGELERPIGRSKIFIESRGPIPKHIDGENSSISAFSGIGENAVKGIGVAIQETHFTRIGGDESSVSRSEDELVGQAWAENVRLIDGDQVALVIDVRDELREHATAVVVRAVVFGEGDVNIVFR